VTRASDSAILAPGGHTLEPQDLEQQRVLGRATDVAIRLGSLALLVGWCFVIVSPFLLPIAWGAIIAVALHGPYAALRDRLGNRAKLAAGLLTLALFLAVLVPSLLVGGSLIDDVEGAATAFREGRLHVPPPPERVAEWPVLGERLYAIWALASQNLQAALAQAGPRLAGVAGSMLSAAARFGISLLQFLFAIVISGVLLARSGAGAATARALAARLMGPRGPEFAELAAATVRGVTRGILGVALIQAILCGVGLFAASVPAAGFWVLAALVLGVIQVGIGLVMIPAAIWLFANAETWTAVAFAVWTVLLLPLDNVLKPILMGRGLDVPVAVIFIGAIGGFVSQGLIGLFVGAVVLVLGYKLWQAWLAGAAPPPHVD
jgi:predicted PurR-regulated permease PerM